MSRYDPLAWVMSRLFPSPTLTNSPSSSPVSPSDKASHRPDVLTNVRALVAGQRALSFSIFTKLLIDRLSGLGSAREDRALVHELEAEGISGTFRNLSSVPAFLNLLRGPSDLLITLWQLISTLTYTPQPELCPSIIPRTCICAITVHLMARAHTP